MLKSILDILQQTFWLTPFIAIPCLIIGFAAISFMIIITLAIFLDFTDNKDVAKHSYNFIFDHL